MRRQYQKLTNAVGNNNNHAINGRRYCSRFITPVRCLLMCCLLAVVWILYTGINATLTTDLDNEVPAHLRPQAKVLLLVESAFTTRSKRLAKSLHSSRIEHKLWVLTSKGGLPDLTRGGAGKFSAIVVEKLEIYTKLDQWNRDLIDKYCRRFDVGVILLSPEDSSSFAASAAPPGGGRGSRGGGGEGDVPPAIPIPGTPVSLTSGLSISDYKVNELSKIPRITKSGVHFTQGIDGDNWTLFYSEHASYRPVATAHCNGTSDSTTSVILEDTGEFDGIRRVYFGGDLSFFLDYTLFVDALTSLSRGRFSVPLKRYIQIDIDDIFVGALGMRLKDNDVDEMLKFQKETREIIPNFTLNLGFSGYYFQKGNKEENLGDEKLIELKDNFNWFPHMYRHTQAHLFINTSKLEEEMQHNLQFANEHGLPTNSGYAVAPHHSGVYPVHEPLYTAWVKVWDIRYTSTEEYPHLFPDRSRKGFIYRGIKVLPRQTCGLFTHNLFFDKYPGGSNKLLALIEGGDLFQTVLHNRINIFMTHMSNYGNDRLAILTFRKLFEFVRTWTNLNLVTVSPGKLANQYFKMYPNERKPVWVNPCNDKRHRAIWSSSKNCSRLPDFIVIGPQKSGTTALYTFLLMHPSIKSNLNTPNNFEEVQFFNSGNYYQGLDWYMSFFPTVGGDPQTQLFEKSANYFDNIDAPYRTHSLLPSASLISILVNPINRAYSWYQHARAHNNKAALGYDFHEMISSDESAPRELRDLKHRCLSPGFYSQHLERWLVYYKPKQILVLDGDELKNNPILVMDKVQSFLGVDTYMDYTDQLRFSVKKGFYCKIKSDGKTSCLGESKGRKYPPIEERSKKILQLYYKPHNIALSKLLTKLRWHIPGWLNHILS